jgi:hypothetical protein
LIDTIGMGFPRIDASARACLALDSGSDVILSLAKHL